MMKAFLSPFLFIFVLFACKGTGQGSSPVTDVEVARAFIRSVLDADFKNAEQYLLKDETNQQYFERFKAQYNSQAGEELDRYKEADIIINEIAAGDSVTVVNYSNSYKRNANSVIKLVRVDGKWLVDLKYTFSGNL